jgi:hypothetical protein
MERNDVIKRFNKSGEIGTRTSGWDGLFRFKPSIIFFTTKPMKPLSFPPRSV